MSVMCADAMTRGVEVKSDKTCLALPYYLDTDRDNCYTHIYEYFKKIGADLKKLGVWVTDVQESRCHIDIGTPSTGVQESNIKKLQESWHRWNPPLAPMPDGPTAIWPELSLMIIQDRHPKILCAHFTKDQGWRGDQPKQTELHMAACSKVPPHIERLWQPCTTNNNHMCRRPVSRSPVCRGQAVSRSPVCRGQVSRGPDACFSLPPE